MPECPVCRSSDIHRKRSRLWILRWTKSKRIFQCRACGHTTTKVAHSRRSNPLDERLAGRSPDLAEIDVAYTQQAEHNRRRSTPQS